MTGPMVEADLIVVMTGGVCRQLSGSTIVAPLTLGAALVSTWTHCHANILTYETTNTVQ